MATYSADVAVRITGKDQLRKLEEAVTKLQTGLTKINGAFANLSRVITAVPKFDINTKAAESSINALQRRVTALSTNRDIKLRVREVYESAGPTNRNNSSGSQGSGLDSGAALAGLGAAQAANSMGELSKTVNGLAAKVQEAVQPMDRAKRALEAKANYKTIFDKGLEDAEKLDREVDVLTRKIRNLGGIGDTSLKAQRTSLIQQMRDLSEAQNRLIRARAESNAILRYTPSELASRAKPVANPPAAVAAEPKRKGGVTAGVGAGLAFANIPGQNIAQAAGAGALVGGPKGAAAAAIVATGVAAAQAGGKIASFYAEVLRGRQALAGISTSSADYAASLKGIESVVNDFNAPIAETTSSFTKLRAATAAVGLDAAETTKVYRALAAANVALGGDSERLQGILLATSQIFSKGKVTAEELRGQLGERLAGAFADFARAGGQSTAQLDAALQKGEVSLSDFLKFTDYAAKKYEKNAMALADSSVSAGDRLTKAWQNLQIAIGPLLQDIGAKFQNFGTSVVNFLTPVIAKVTDLLGLSRQSQNDRLFNVRGEIAKIDETLRKIPEGQRRISAGLQDANGNLLGAGVDIGARLRAERAALVKEEKRLSAALNQKTGGQQVSKNLTLTNTEQQERDREKALEKELGIRSALRQLAIQQVEVDTVAGLIGKDRLSQLVAQFDAMKEVQRLTDIDIRQSGEDPRIQAARQGLAVAEFQRETKKLNEEVDLLLEEVKQLGLEGATMRRELLGGQMQATETPLQTAIRETKEELLDADAAAVALLNRLNDLVGTNPEGAAARTQIGTLREDIAATDPVKVASQKLAQADISALEEQVATLKRGAVELSTLDQLIIKYGKDWAALDPLVKGHLVNLARQTDQLAKTNQEQQKLQDLFNGIGNEVTNGLVNGLVMAVSATDRLGESMQNLAGDILNAIGKALILNAITGALGGLAGDDGVGFFSILAGKFGKRAAGGPVSGGTPYLVGEEGPELILPQRSGYVLNARETEDALADSRRALSGRGAESETSAFNENKEMLSAVTNNIATRVAEASQSNRTPVQVEYRGPQLTFNGDDYLPKDAAVAIIEEASQRGARLGHQRTMGQLKNNPGARRTIGI